MDAEDFGHPNPGAPAELSQFAFLIGRWRCDAVVTPPGSDAQKFEAAWIGRYILDGYVIADEYGMAIPAGERIVLGMNFCVYDPARRQWNLKWLSALTGTWVDLGREELGGVHYDGQSIVYCFKEPMAPHAYTRATYTDFSASHFTWRGEKSDDMKTWAGFMILEAYRVSG